MNKILLDRPLHKEALNLLKKNVEVIEIYYNDTEKLIKNLTGVEGVICSAVFKIGKKEIENSKNLKVIGRPGVGYDNVDISAATNAGIPVVYAPDGPTESVAEHVFGLTIMLAKKINVVEKALRARGDFLIRTRVTGMELYGKTIGLIGAGRIGKRVAEIAKKAFNMKIIIFDPYLSDCKDFLNGEFSRMENLSELLKNSDVISVHIPFNKKTEKFIGEKEIDLMKSTAIFINTSRGGVVDEKALITALKNGKIAGAGLDVFEKEPPDPDNPLFKLENTVVTPHLSSFTDEGKLKMGMDVVKGALDVLEGRKPQFIVNPGVWDNRKK
jgi:D-3-phosphoglycerate dehydrogenase